VCVCVCVCVYVCIYLCNLDFYIRQAAPTGLNISVLCLY
jgi:hypothetical protein